jgi:hypothetical protein
MKTLTSRERMILLRFFVWYMLFVSALVFSVDSYVYSVNADFFGTPTSEPGRRWRDAAASVLFLLSVVPLVLPGMPRWVRFSGVLYWLVGIGLMWPLI